MLVLQRKGGALLAFSEGDDAWSQLQEPSHAARMNSVYRRLLAALDSGWKIEEPAYLLPRWGEGSARVYHFILRRAPANAEPTKEPPHLLVVPESREIEQFVRAENLELVVGR